MSSTGQAPKREGGRSFNPNAYVTVAERIGKFYETYQNGRIVTSVIEHDSERGFILMRAEVYRNPDDAEPAASGHAYEYKSEGYVQRSSYIETCETSAVGRALAFLNFETKRGIASREEMEKAERYEERQQPPRTSQSSPVSNTRPATQSSDRADLINEGQMKAIRQKASALGINLDDFIAKGYDGRSLDQLSYAEGVDLIRGWSKS